MFQILNDTVDNEANQLTFEDRLSIAASFGLALFGVSSPVVRSLGAPATDVFELWALNTALHGIASAGPQTLFGLVQAEEFLKGVLTDKGLDCCKKAIRPSSDILLSVALPLEVEIANKEDPTEPRKLVQAVVAGKVPPRPAGTLLSQEQWFAEQLLGKNSPFKEGSAILTTEDTQALSDAVEDAFKEAFGTL